MPSSLLQVVNNLFQTCYNKLGTSSANTTCEQTCYNLMRAKREQSRIRGHGKKICFATRYLSKNRVTNEITAFALVYTYNTTNGVLVTGLENKNTF